MRGQSKSEGKEEDPAKAKRRLRGGGLKLYKGKRNAAPVNQHIC